MIVRVVLLKKISTLQAGCIHNLNEKDSEGPWISLGHFDAFYSYKIPSNNMFQEIGENNIEVSQRNDKSAYYHPLYLISSEGEKDKQLWEDKNWYMTISRIHFVQNVNVARSREKLREKLEKELKEDANQGIISLGYQTIELSDMILVSRSDNMETLLKFTLNLRSHPDIGNVYTYCGINYDYVSDLKAIPLGEDRIPFFSMRFSIKDYAKAQQALGVIKELLDEPDNQGEVYSIAGLNDAVGTWTNLCTWRLIELYRHWFVRMSEKRGISKEAFSNVTTRVGVGAVSPGECSPGEDEFNKKLLSICDILLDLEKSIQEHNKNSGQFGIGESRWLKTLSELTKTLARLGKTVVMDEFVFLMLPAVFSFLTNVLDVVRRGDMTREHLAGYHEYIEEWNHLMEHIMRSEGQLTHYSELRPILYDMPLAMLEYTLAFLMKCSHALQSQDGNESVEIDFLLVPQLCRRNMATELFPARKDFPGLVSVQVPLHLLYDPKVVMSQLCHEISHFVGERPRHRKLRQRCYAQSVSGVLAQYVFQSYFSELTATIANELETRFKAFNLQRIEEMRNETIKWLNELLSGSPRSLNYAEFIRKIVIKSAGKGRLEVQHDIVALKDAAMQYVGMLKAMGEQYREVYADLCMLNLLSLDPSYYLDSCMKELSEDWDEERDETAMEILVMRYYVCEQANFSSGGLSREKREGPVWEKFKKKYGDISLAVMDKKSAPETFFPPEAVLPLLEYAKACDISLKECFKDNKEAQKAKTIFDGATGENVDYTQWEQYINEYRVDLLEKMDSASSV